LGVGSRLGYADGFCWGRLGVQAGDLGANGAVQYWLQGGSKIWVWGGV